MPESRKSPADFIISPVVVWNYILLEGLGRLEINPSVYPPIWNVPVYTLRICCTDRHDLQWHEESHLDNDLKRKAFHLWDGADCEVAYTFPFMGVGLAYSTAHPQRSLQQWVTSEGNFIAAIALKYPIDERATTLTPLHPHSIRMLLISDAAWAEGSTERMRQAHSRREWGDGWVGGWAATVNSTGGKITTGNHLGAGGRKWGWRKEEVDSGEERTLSVAKQMNASERAERMKGDAPVLMLIVAVLHAWSNQQTHTYHEVQTFECSCKH